jgi:hypothetical protein
MAVSPPFSIATTAPATPDLISQYPTVEHLYRDTVDSWLKTISDATTGLLKPAGFPNPLALTGAVSFAGDVSFTGALTKGSDTVDHFPAGTRIVFMQNLAPTGWVKETNAAYNDIALRATTGTQGSGGSMNFSAAFSGARSVSGSVGYTTAGGTVAGHVLTEAELANHAHGPGNLYTATDPGHYHTVSGNFIGSGTSSNGGYLGGSTLVNTSTAGAHWHYVVGGITNSAGSNAAHSHGFTGSAHNHAFTGDAMNFAVKYVDVIIGTKS